MLLDRTKEAEPIFFILVKYDMANKSIEFLLPYFIGRISQFGYPLEIFNIWLKEVSIGGRES